MRQNEGLPDVNLWLSSSWPVILIHAMALPRSVPDVARSQPLPFPTAHPHSAHHSPGVSLHPTRLESLIKSNSPKSLPASDEQRGPGKWQSFQELLVLCVKQVQTRGRLKFRPSMPQRHHRVTSQHGTVSLCLLLFPPSLHYLVWRKKHFLRERERESVEMLVYQSSCALAESLYSHPLLGDFYQG